MSHSSFQTKNGHHLAYHLTLGQGPTVVFLGGFKSDMEGSKALFLEQQMQAQGRAFLRFDYSGHGASDREFTEGAIGEWAQDAFEIIAALAGPKAILVGSSMGGWISLLLARMMPSRIAGLVGIAAAPDFTEDSMWANFSDAQREEMKKTGQVALPSDYGEPYIITQKLITEGRNNLVLREPLSLPFPVRLLHGTADVDVTMDRPLAIMDHADADDLRVTFVKGADHRFSESDNLELILSTVAEVSLRAANVA